MSNDLEPASDEVYVSASNAILLRNGGDGGTVPLVCPQPVPADVTDRFVRGAQAVGAGEAVVISGAPGAGARSGLSVGGGEPLATLRAALAGGAAYALVTTRAPAGTLLVTPLGYALLTGDRDFMRAAVPQGADRLRAAFFHLARKATTHQAQWAEVARAHPPRFRAWSTAPEVEPGTGTAAQLALMSGLMAGTVPPEEFPESWLAARRAALHAGERVRDPLSRALDDVFFAVEDYEPDPELYEEGELTADELIEAVTRAWELAAGG